jgi:hypothetical protein
MLAADPNAALLLGQAGKVLDFRPARRRFEIPRRHQREKNRGIR